MKNNESKPEFTLHHGNRNSSGMLRHGGLQIDESCKHAEEIVGKCHDWSEEGYPYQISIQGNTKQGFILKSNNLHRRYNILLLWLAIAAKQRVEQPAIHEIH